MLRVATAQEHSNQQERQLLIQKRPSLFFVEEVHRSLVFALPPTTAQARPARQLVTEGACEK